MVLLLPNTGWVTIIILILALIFPVFLWTILAGWLAEGWPSDGLGLGAGQILYSLGLPYYYPFFLLGLVRLINRLWQIKKFCFAF